MSDTIDLLPFGKTAAPSPFTWKRLYLAAKEFSNRRPWESIENANLVCIDDPAFGEIAWCSVLGSGGIEFGLHAYIGDAGLRVWSKAIQGLGEAGEALLTMRSLGLNLGTRDDMDSKDLAITKKLLINFPGGRWPVFRSFHPGYTPWYLDEQEAQFMVTCIEQVLGAADGKWGKVNRISPLTGGNCLTRIRGEQGWRSDYRRCEIPAELSCPQPVFDADSIEKLRKKPVRKGLFWEVDCPRFPGEIGDTEPPRLCRMIVCLESSAGYSISQELLESHLDPAVETFRVILNLFGSAEEKPEQIHFSEFRPFLMESLSPFLEKIGIKARSLSDLKYMPGFISELKRHFEEEQWE